MSAKPRTRSRSVKPKPAEFPVEVVFKETVVYQGCHVFRAGQRAWLRESVLKLVRDKVEVL